MRDAVELLLLLLLLVSRNWEVDVLRREGDGVLSASDVEVMVGEFVSSWPLLVGSIKLWDDAKLVADHVWAIRVLFGEVGSSNELLDGNRCVDP